MSIENPHSAHTNVNDRGEHAPSEQHDPRFGGDHDVPAPRGEETYQHQDTYTLPPQERDDTQDTQPGFLRKHWAKAALGLTGIVATGAALFAGHEMGKNDRPAGPAPDQPAATSEPFPSGSTATSTTEQPATSEKNPTGEISTGAVVAINGEVYKFDEAKADLFTISLEEAPTIEAAVNKYAEVLASGMNLNVERGVVIQQGGAEAVSDINYNLLTGETGLLTNLGDGHAEVLRIPSDYTEPSELVWEVSTKNATDETTSEVYIINPQITETSPGNYKVRGDLLVTSKNQSDGQAKNTDEYKLDMVAHQDPATGTWNFGKKPYNTHIMR